MTENSIKKQNILYAAIGVMTLIVATIGATFAYYTATQTAGSNIIKGNMATITFDLGVTKMTNVDESKGGLIPMSNTMVQSAVTSGKGICVDDNNNAVCQVYKITVTNTGTASMFIDGYVTLTGGSGVATDYTTATNKTTMRWAQLFCNETSGTISGCTTAGKTTTGATKEKTTDSSIKGIDGDDWNALGNTTRTISDGDSATDKKTKTNAMAHDVDNILTTGITTTAYISGNPYKIIDKNFIRISDHTAANGYTQNADMTSALVYNEYLSAKNDTANPVGGSSATYTDSQVYYIVVWLSETGVDQTATTTSAGTPAKSGLNFYQGTVTFNSAQGSEVTATFSGYEAVNPDTKPQS